VRRILFISTLLILVPTGGQSAASVPLTDAVERVEFTLQVGTFSSRNLASRMISQIPDSWVQEIESQGAPTFRVNYKRFGDRNAALRAQWTLEDLGYKSFIQRLYS
jgi:SPOR domain